MYESPRKKGRPLTENERNLISHLLRLGHTQTDIAKVIGVYPSTICRELRRGEVELLNSDKWIYYKTYSPQKAQMQADYMKTAHGDDLLQKILQHFPLEGDFTTEEKEDAALAMAAALPAREVDARCAVLYGE